MALGTLLTGLAATSCHPQGLALGKFVCQPLAAIPCLNKGIKFLKYDVFDDGNESKSALIRLDSFALWHMSVSMSLLWNNGEVAQERFPHNVLNAVSLQIHWRIPCQVRGEARTVVHL